MPNFTLVKWVQIDGDFEGFDDGAVFRLADGTYWIQDQYLFWYHCSCNPWVLILRSDNRYYLQVAGKDKIVAVRRLRHFHECQIDGAFTGWDIERAYRLTNGEVWQQSRLTYEYADAFKPEALIYEAASGTRMLVEGTNVGVRRIG